jgi:general secretion pathway protein B
MSYILEALKKSELERQQRSLPELISAPARIGQPEFAKSSSRLGLGVGVLVLVAGVAGFAWWRWASAPVAGLPPHGAVPPSGSAAAALQTAELASREPTVAAGGIPPGNVEIEGPAAEVTARDAGESRPGASSGTAPSEPAPAGVALPGGERTTAAPRPAKSGKPVGTAPKVSAEPGEGGDGVVSRQAVSQGRAAGKGGQGNPNAAPEQEVSTEAAIQIPPNRVTTYGELPGSIRKNLPRIQVAGYSFADDAGMRMVVINDRILREGEEVAAGIKLERIDSDGKLTLNYKGFRFRPPQ